MAENQKPQASWVFTYHTVLKPAKGLRRFLCVSRKAFTVGVVATLVCGPVAAETGLLARLSDLEAALSRVENEQAVKYQQFDRELESMKKLNEHLGLCVSVAREASSRSKSLRDAIMLSARFCKVHPVVGDALCELEDELGTKLELAEKKSEMLSDTLTNLLNCLQITD